ncbi:rRNA pseudouridine synthase [Candidatus Peregrinibacteria bacterium]|jgi:23S rRNA pseudouridine2605 synthase|nr:rRNA pseudouridine synthase [Candidatus Peregrinibacteria bacterium]MBT4055866.1 rRNA pseudouridine synthase [Candidatus Peregrinibacteria bacterium]
MRLNKFLAQSGLTSRRKADQLIEKGEVFVNGKCITRLGTIIDPSKDKVILGDKILDKQPIELKKRFKYLAINKPEGYVTTLEDPHNETTIMDLVPKRLAKEGLKPIGRLDKNSEGLIVLTNDLEFINEMTHPKYEKEKEYFVIIKGKLTTAEQEQLEKGILLEGKKTLPCKINPRERQKTKTRLTITLREGRKRQIRKMFQHLNHHVLYLQRIRIGDLKLGPLKKGQSELINKECLQA